MISSHSSQNEVASSRKDYLERHLILTETSHCIHSPRNSHWRYKSTYTTRHESNGTYIPLLTKSWKKKTLSIYILETKASTGQCSSTKRTLSHTSMLLCHPTSWPCKGTLLLQAYFEMVGYRKWWEQMAVTGEWGSVAWAGTNITSPVSLIFKHKIHGTVTSYHPQTSD